MIKIKKKVTVTLEVNKASLLLLSLDVDNNKKPEGFSRPQRGRYIGAHAPMRHDQSFTEKACDRREQGFSPSP